MAEYNPSKIIKDGNTYNFRDTTKIPLAGSNEISGSLIPNTDGTVNLGSPSYQWNNAYIKSLTINGVACGDILTHNASEFANDTDVVHKSGNEAKSGELTLSDTLNSSDIVPRSNNTYAFGSVSNLLRNLYTYHGYFRGQQQGDEYSPNARTNLTLTSNRDTLGQSGIVFDSFRENTAQGTGSHILGFGLKENSVRYEGCRFFWFYDDNNNGYIFSLRPTTQGTNRPIKYELGTSSAKWSTINDLNPSSLSMPDLSNRIDISSYIDVTQTSQYTAPADGYISICGYASSTNAILIKDHNCDFAMTARDMTTSLGATTYLTIPVVKNHVYDITCSAVTIIEYAKFYPCQGNV